MKPAAIYARVSSARQKEEHTIASQTEALRAISPCSKASAFPMNGCSRMRVQVLPSFALASKVRDLAAEGQIDAVLVHSPDRLSRKSSCTACY